MGGKTSQSSSQVTIPPEVLARYNSVNATAEQVAQTPFQQYSTNPNAFVAPLTPTQTSGIQNTNAAAGMAQPYFQAGTGFALAGSQPINAQPLDTSAYMNPYLQTVLGSTAAMINQNNQQAMAGQTGNAINQGYFGGDRSGIAAAVLQGQQNLAAGQVYSGIASDAYNQALAAAQQQQGVNLSAEQANRAALQQTGESLAGLGTGAQGAALQGAQAQLGAGQAEQQTQQAGLTALYNQFLQQQSYPFQTAQFLANIAEGTGALSGSTTTSTQPQSIFSDERLKEGMEPVGKGFDGANIYRFRYRGDPTTRIGFSAQEIEQVHPEAVSTHPSGFKMVDYGKATDAAAGFARAANDDYLDYDEPRRARAAGGRVGYQGGGMPLSTQPGISGAANPYDLAMILQAQEQSYAPFAQAGLYGGGAGAGPYGGVQGHVPAANLPVGHLQVAAPPPAPSGGLGQDIHEAANLADDAKGISEDYHIAHKGYDWVRGLGHHGDADSDVTTMGGPPNANGGRIGRAPGGGLSWGGDQITPGVLSPELRRQIAAAKIAQARRPAAQPRLVGRPTAPPTPGPAAPVPGQPGVVRQPGAFGATPIYEARHDPNPLSGAWNFLTKTNVGDPVGDVVGGLWHGAQNLANQQTAWMGNRDLLGRPTAPAATGDPHALQRRLFRAQLDPGAQAQFDHHSSMAQAHANAAQDILASGATGRASPDLVLNTGREQPLANTQSIVPSAADVANLQGGFSGANIQPYHEGLFQRVGDWLGGHFGSDAQRMAYDARGMTPDNSVQPIQSRAFQPAAVDQHPDLASAAAPVIQSEAFQPRSNVVSLADAIDANPQLAARGGFAGARRGFDLGGAPDPSDPRNDDPYKPQGPGLNIPTADTQHAKLATAAPPSQGGGGLGSAIGMGSDLVNIAKFALPFFGVPLQTGGRVGYQGGGDVPDDQASQMPAPTEHDADATPAAAAADTDTAPAPKQPGFGAAAQPPQGGHGGFLSGLFHGVEGLGEDVAHAAGYEGGGKWNIDKLMPLLSAIGTAGSVPTVHPFVALAAGLGGYGKAYMAQKQQEAQINQEQANAQLTRFQAEPALMQQNMVEVPGADFNPDGTVNLKTSRQIAPGQYVHRISVADAMGVGQGGQGGAGPSGATMTTQQGDVSAAGAPAAHAISRGPIRVDYAHGTQSFAPSTTSDQFISGLLGQGTDTSGTPQGAIRNKVLINMRGLGGQEQAANASYASDQANQSGLQTSSRQLQQLALAINAMPKGGLGAMGENYEERQSLLRMVQTANRIITGQDDQSINADTSPGDLVRKIQGLASTQLTQQAGLHASGVQEMLQHVLPGGGSANVGVANQLIASMMVANQQLIDKPAFEQAYAAKYGTMLGADQAFQAETSGMYGDDQTALERMMTRGKSGKSIAEYMMQNPNSRRSVELGVRQGQQYRPGVGIGTGRYWTERLQ